MSDVLSQACKHALAFREGLADRPPRPVAAAADILEGFDGPTPEHGQSGASVIDALATAADPGLMAIPGPRFFGWVMGGSHEIGVAADWLTSAWGQNAGLYAATPSAAIAEKVAARWLLDILELPRDCSVGFVTGATMANFVCLAAARSAVLRSVGWDVEKNGLMGAPRVRIFVGADAHTSVFAALRYLGFGDASATIIATDDQGRMRADALAEKLAEGEGPAIVIAQAGQINTGAIDPAPAIAESCRKHKAWLHIDGAFGLWARVAPELADQAAGLDKADSWATDGHKWLQLPFDSGFAIVRDADAHRRAMTIAASYLPAADEYEPSHYVPELSRRARGFAAWATIRCLGRRGIADMVRRHCTFALMLSTRLSAEPGISILNNVTLNQVIVAFGDSDDETKSVIAKIQRDNICFAAGGSWRGRWVMRLPIIAAALGVEDIARLAEAIIAAWRHVQTESGAAEKSLATAQH